MIHLNHTILASGMRRTIAFDRHWWVSGTQEVWQKIRNHRLQLTESPLAKGSTACLALLILLLLWITVRDSVQSVSVKPHGLKVMGFVKLWINSRTKFEVRFNRIFTYHICQSSVAVVHLLQRKYWQIHWCFPQHLLPLLVVTKISFTRDIFVGDNRLLPR